ncbi:unnamed protein product, partial [marine sediment metagenome]
MYLKRMEMMKGFDKKVFIRQMPDEKSSIIGDLS